MADVIQLRRGPAEQWAEVNPVLRSGEPGFETDTGRHKIGDGERAWDALPYFLDEPALHDWYTAHAPSVTAAPGGLVINVRDEKYGATGDGSTDDTAAIQAAIDDTGTGGTCYFPPGTYLVGSGGGARALLGRNGITLAGAGPRLSTLRCANAGRLLDLSGRYEVRVRDLGFDGSSQALSGVFASYRGGQKNITVERCRFVDFMPGMTNATEAAVYVWTSDGVHVRHSEFIGCGRAVTIDQPDGVVNVVGNRVTAAEAGVMATGINVRRSSSTSESEVLVHGNYVSGADLDPGGQGAEGHGIAVFRCRDVQVSNNHLEDNGRGILVSYLSFGAVVQGNTCVGNHDAGIRCEPEISSTSTTVGTGTPRGVTVIGNVSRNNAGIGELRGANSGIGITVSYAAGSVVSGNLVHDNTGDGIHCDSDRVTIVGNVVYNNWTGYDTDPVNGRRGGIRIYVGNGCVVVGNQCYDNQSSKTQHYGLSLTKSSTGHVVHGNNFTGNASGEVFGRELIKEGFFGATPVARRPAPGTANALNTPQVLNNVIEGLRELGLFS